MSVANVSHFSRVHTEDIESHSLMSNCLQPHGLYNPWNSPGQNSGVGSHCLLPPRNSFSLSFVGSSLVAQSHPTLCDPMDCSLPGSSIRAILQVRILEWVAISHSKGSSRPRNRTHISCISCIDKQILYHCATWEAPIITLRE